MTPRLQRLVREVGSLPTLPTVLVQVTDLLNNPKSSALQLSRVILKDSALTARLLRLVNSPYYGFPRRIATVTEALSILGSFQVRNLLLMVTVVDLLSGEETPDFSPMKLWEHSVEVAVAAGLLARQVCPQDREELFVAGLLHDVGMLVEFQFLREGFLQALSRSRSEDIPIRVAEQQILGFGHDQVGRLVVEHWKLPIRLTEAIACHHRPDLALAAKREAAITHVADILCHALGSGGDEAVPPLDQEAWQRLRLPVTALEPMLAELELQHEEAKTILLDRGSAHSQCDEQVAHAY